MSKKSKRSTDKPHKLGADRHDPAIKHEKADGKKRHKDIHEDRSQRQHKLGKPRTR